jgi:hypothetical protein
MQHWETASNGRSPVAAVPALQSRSKHMTPFIPAAQVVVSVAILSGAIATADAQVLPVVLPAPVGHFQPHEPGYAPRAPSTEDERQRLSQYDVEQSKRDRELDSKLNICRGC